MALRSRGASSRRFSTQPAPMTSTASPKSSKPSGSFTARTSSPPISAMARSNGSKLACCLLKIPSFCSSTNPLPGMTDSETEETAKLLREISQTRSVVVVEHDMSFVRELGSRVVCLAEAPFWQRARSTRSAPILLSSKGIWDDEHCPFRKDHRSPLRCRSSFKGISIECAPSRITPLCSVAMVWANPRRCAPLPGQPTSPPVQ